MKACECGSRRFAVDAIYVATDHIVLDDDGSQDFNVIDTNYGDGEWEDDGTVRCEECGKEMTYSEWQNQDEDEDIPVEATL